MAHRFSLFILLFSIVVFSSPVFCAEDESKDAAIKELLATMDSMASMEASLSAMQNTISMNSPYFLKEIKTILARDFDEKDVAAASELYQSEGYGADRLYQLFRYKFSLERVQKEIMIPVYRDNYTKEEIEQLTSFFRSELGQKTLRINAEISKTIATKTRDMSQMALNQAKEELAHELSQKIKP